MKARILAVLCAVLFTMGTLTGCGNSASDSKDTDTEAEVTAEITEEVTEETSEEEIDEEPVSETEALKAGFTDGEEESGKTTEESENSSEEADSDTTDSEEAEAGTESADAAGTDTEETDEEETVVLDTSSELTGIHHATISIEDYGEIQIELDADTAPITVTNFVKLAQEGFYDGLTFWRIMDGFMIQGGDPEGNGTGGSDDTIKGEFSNNGVDNDISHVRGVISMARSSDPDSASSQFFIVQTDSTFLDGDYAAFGEVTDGMDIVDQICKDAEPTDDNGTIEKDEQPVIESIKIVD